MVEVTGDKITALAKIVHEANKAYCEVIGDYSQKSWEEAPEYNRRSAIVGVTAMCDNPSMTPEESHDVWVETKKADGWVYGDIKDGEKKTHPCLVPYDQLDRWQKFKDTLFQGIVKLYLGSLGPQP